MRTDASSPFFVRVKSVQKFADRQELGSVTGFQELMGQRIEVFAWAWGKSSVPWVLSFSVCGVTYEINEMNELSG